jgi:hypothetical protein
MFGFKNREKKKAEQDLAAWLAHPNEYGVAPKKVSHKRSYKVNFLAYGPLLVHLLNYEMPNGTKGRGFVNPFPFAFGSDGLDVISDNDLLVCYCGMAWLMNSRQNGLVKTEFPPAGDEARFLETKMGHGFQDVQITERYLIRETEMFSYSASYQGVKAQGAGNSKGDVAFREGEPLYLLPAIYTLLGIQMTDI